MLPPSTMLPEWTGQAAAGTMRTCAPAQKSEPDISAVRARVVFTSESGVISATEGTGTTAPVIPITRGRRMSANTVRADRSAGTFMEQPHRKQCVKGRTGFQIPQTGDRNNAFSAIIPKIERQNIINIVNCILYKNTIEYALETRTLNRTRNRHTLSQSGEISGVRHMGGRVPPT